MSQQDPLANFLGDLAKKIKVTKEHKDIMEAVYASASATEIVKEQDDPFAGFLQKVGKALSEKIPIKENIEKPKESPPLVVEIAKPIEKIPEPEPKENEPVKSLAYKIKEAIEKAKNKALSGVLESAEENNEEKPKTDEPEDEQIATYISELEKIKDTGTVQQKEEAITSLKELKEYVDKTVKDYSRKILDLGSGGGTVAVQYANGGTMNGDLNINGHILSGGRNISDYFGSGGGGGNQNLSFNQTNYDLSISSGNTVNLGVLKDNLTEIVATSGSWNEAYTNLVNNSAAYLLSGTDVNLGDIPTLSGTWNEAYTNLVTNSASYLLSGTEVYLGDIPVLSANWTEAYTNLVSNSSAYLSGVDISLIIATSGDWDSVYSTTNANSAYWVDVRNDVVFNQDVTIQGNLTALGSSTFKNTIFTTTSALSVVNTGPGPALYVFQSSGPYDVASFYDGDGVEVLHVGNATTGSHPKGHVGINESFPAVELTVSGQISASESITVDGGNSNQWNSNYSTTNTNSGTWNTAYTNLVTNSATYLGTTRQYDYVQDGLNSYSYCGYAIPGTLTSSTGWTINRLFFSSAGTLLSSGAVTNVIWDNRYSYTY